MEIMSFLILRPESMLMRRLPMVQMKYERKAHDPFFTSRNLLHFMQIGQEREREKGRT